jgi:UPF0716 protein FxsA
MGKLFLAFTLVPIVDLWLTLRIGRALGVWPTIALLVASGVVGAWLARVEGARVLSGWRAALAAGRMPEEGILSGVLVLVGAALLVSPGIVSDVVGLALLFPPTRRIAADGLRAWLARKLRRGQVRIFTMHGPGARDPGDDPDVIDVTPPPRRRPPEVIDVTPPRGPRDGDLR